MNDLDPLAYLTDILMRIVNGHPTAISIGCCRGHEQESRGLETALTASLIARGHDLELRTAGDGSKWAGLESAVARLGLIGKVIFLGSVEGREAATNYFIRLVVLPTRTIRLADQDIWRKVTSEHRLRFTKPG